MRDILDDRSVNHVHYWANNKRHEQGDDSKCHLIVPLDDILAYQQGPAPSSLRRVVASVTATRMGNRDQPQSDNNIRCANVCPRYSTIARARRTDPTEESEIHPVFVVDRCEVEPPSKLRP